MIASATGDERRCVDDAFVRICQMVTDLSMKVRVQAAGLLGSLHLVSQIYLQQTLHKKVMSHLKVSFQRFPNEILSMTMGIVY